MKLELGMYVRTKNGMIAKIIDKRDVSGSLHREEIVFILDNGNRLALHSKKVIKASHSIIDLIEVGDYVNGVRIDELSHNRFTNAKAVSTNNSLRKDTGKQYWFENEDIKSIVTKEAFESMSYKVGE